MRNLVILLALVSPLAGAESLRVDANTLTRLPTGTGALHLERLEIADHGALLIPASVNELRVDEVRLGREARIAIAPSEQPFRLAIGEGEIAAGSRIDARGAPGKQDKAASAGRDLRLRLERVEVADLTVDVRGGRGTPGYAGLHGADGEPGGCLWGQASRGHHGLEGGDGQDGAAGGRVRLEVQAGFPLERVQVRLDGGAGGLAGEGGEGGAAGAAKSCLLYKVEGAPGGRPGQPGKPGEQGAAGSLEIIQID